MSAVKLHTKKNSHQESDILQKTTAIFKEKNINHRVMILLENQSKFGAEDNEDIIVTWILSSIQMHPRH